MPEGPEIRIMSDFINEKTKDKVFRKAFHVNKGNNPIEFEEDLSSEIFQIISSFYGKKLILHLKSNTKNIPIYIFMGMSGSWKWVQTENWNETKFIRLRFDSDDGYSLIMFGGYMGPKYSIHNNFKNSKSGPDLILDFDKFKENIFDSIQKKLFEKPIYEVLLNQDFFNGVGNYLRSTILFYADVNPFQSARIIIKNNPNFLNICQDILIKAYQLNGGQLKDWSNPFEKDSSEFSNWVYYKKGDSIKDSSNRTFWYNPKWKA